MFTSHLTQRLGAALLLEQHTAYWLTRCSPVTSYLTQWHAAALLLEQHTAYRLTMFINLRDSEAWCCPASRTAYGVQNHKMFRANLTQRLGAALLLEQHTAYRLKCL